MKKNLLVPIACFIFQLFHSQNITIPDANFKNVLINSVCVDTNGDGTLDDDVDTNNDGEIQISEAEAVSNLVFAQTYNQTFIILEITGLEYFVNLVKLDFGWVEFYDRNNLDTAPTELDLSSLTNLQSLFLNHAESVTLTSINLSGLENLTVLELLEIRPISYSDPNRFTYVNLSGCTNLEEFSYYNSFLNINFCQIPNLKNLNCSYLEGGEPETFDFSCLSKLENLDISENTIDRLILKNGSVLNNIVYNNIGLNGYPFPNFICLDDLQEEYNMVSDLIGPNTEVSYTCQTAEDEIIDIPDVNFKNALIEQGVDTNNDNEIQISEAENRTLLAISNQGIKSLEGIQYFINLVTLSAFDNLISSVDLSALTKLKSLSLANNSLTSLDISLLTDLEYLYLNNNSLASLNVGTLSNLIQLDCSYNSLTSLDISNLLNLENLNSGVCNLSSIDIGSLNNLKILSLHYNELTELDITNVPNLVRLACNSNQLTSLDLSNLPNLENFNCQVNPFTELDFSALPNIKYLTCGHSYLSMLDVSNLTKLEQLNCGNTPNLTTLIIKNSSLETNYFLFNIPNLNYICCDDFEVSTINEIINNYGYTDCEVNTYCTFKPGGKSYSIQGQYLFNEDGSSCDNAMPFKTSMKYKVENNTSNGVFISNDSGFYKNFFKEGEYTITPILENLNYFTISPSAITINLQTNTNTLNQNFCITPNGTHNDLEISILPINRARPGFDTNYKIVYKNKGNQTLSGSIELDFQDNLMDFNTSNPIVDSQSTNLLTWNYNNLAPFESKEILITFNINTPLETPSVNDGDILNFSANIYPKSDDETETDNTFTLNQTVVNSFDPNDKTCLEGNTIIPDLIGEYVHYLIRCENTGTAEAINIVIKDIIDTTKFDISSIVITDSSHSMETKINDNVVEFIFENINLPYDDANNDGYVAFKIKTLPTLAVGDVFENDAEIYFDYNSPIVTNKFQTKIENTLGLNKNNYNKTLKIYPNPAYNHVIIDSKEPIESLAIYDISGRLIAMNSFLKNKITAEVSISNLLSGTYFIKVKTEQGEHVTKFLKK